jgi:uncharacterized integral membrane protein
MRAVAYLLVGPHMPWGSQVMIQTKKGIPWSSMLGHPIKLHFDETYKKKKRIQRPPRAVYMMMMMMMIIIIIIIILYVQNLRKLESVYSLVHSFSVYLRAV